MRIDWMVLKGKRLMIPESVKQVVYQLHNSDMGVEKPTHLSMCFNTFTEYECRYIKHKKMLKMS